MATLSLEQQQEIPLLIAGAAERIRSFLASVPQELEIIRPEEFCRSPDFCKDQNLDTVTLIYKLEKGEASPSRVEFLSRAGEEALVRSVNLNDESALSRAVAYGSLAVYHLAENMPERGTVISAFARTLRQRWNVSQKDSHLDEAIYYFQKTVELEPPDEANRPFHLDDLGQALMDRYKRFRRDEDFTEAKRSFELAASLEHSARPMFLSGLGRIIMERAIFEHPQDMLAFDDSIRILNSAHKCVTEQYKGSISTIYYHLGHAYTNRFKASQDPGDWKKAEGSFEEAISRLTYPSPNHLSTCYNIARVYSDNFGQYRRVQDSDKAQAYYRLALQSSPDNPTVLASLAEDLRFGAYCSGSQTILDESIQLIEKAVQATPPTDPQLPFRLGRQANALSDRFLLLGNIADIDQAISSLRKCLEAAGLNDNDGWKYWEMLGHGLLLRYENVQDADDLQNAEAAISCALEFDGLEAGPKSTCLNVLGRIFFMKYIVDYNLEDLEKSIEHFQESIKLADSEDFGVYLAFNDLGNSLMEKFELSSSNADLQAAATSYHKALENLRHRRDKSLREHEAMLLHGLGNVQLRQFQLWSRTSDLDAAISYYKKSVDSTPDFNIRIATRTGTLCWALQERFDISYKIGDLEEAQRRLEDVIVLPLQLSASSKSYLENRIGMVYLRFFFCTKDVKHLDPAAAHFRNALAAGSKEPAYNVSASNNLAITLNHKADATRSDTDITAALIQFSNLLQSLTKNAPEMGSVAINVAEFFSSIYTLKKVPAMGKMALAAYSIAVSAGRVSPQRRISTKMKAARLSFVVAEDAVAASNLLKLAIEDLPEAVMAGLNRGDQLRIIRDFVWLPSNIAAFSTAAGESAEESLRLFESSRSIIWDNFLNDKSDIGPLEAHHPELAQRFKYLQTRLAQTMPSSKFADPEPALMLKRQDNHQASLDYNETLTQIRTLEGFENFLRLPQGRSSLSDYAIDGPLVIISSNEFRSDSFIIKREGVVSIPLPEMTLESSAQNVASFEIALSEMGHSPEQASSKFEKVLIWLWNAVAQPIMKELGLLEPNRSKSEIPRVWWMATGWIGMLPIHAAGDHRKALDTGTPCSVLDLTISSYFNSLRSLKYARETLTILKSSATDISNSQKSFLVQMPETPDNEPLPGASVEVSTVRNIMEDCNVTANVLESPTRDQVLRHLKSCDVAHFACHGTADAEDPSLSKLLLKDWKERPLNIRALLRTKNLNCKLVFLSACESAVGKDRKLREEGIHLSGGFQMAGVPHVIGTLWKVQDIFSGQITEKFYDRLQKDNVLDVERSAEALREAVIDSRTKGVNSLLWAAYIHSGP
ncbi:hypothetical protein MMC16_005896 [Acarospora aff. strigata]|nr:hypothetical protein [Acarospora aff. strigata]